MANSISLVVVVLLLLSRAFAAEKVQLWECEAAMLELLCSFLADLHACCCMVGLLL